MILCFVGFDSVLRFEVLREKTGAKYNISIVWSKSVDKSNTKYYDVFIKWVNMTTSVVNIYKTYTLYCDIVVKWLNIFTLTVNIAKRCILY